MSSLESTRNLLRQNIPSPTEPEVAGSAERLRSWYLERATRIDWADLDSPFGPLYLAAGPHGLIRIALRADESAFLAELDGRARLQYQGDRISEPVQALRAYFSQRKLAFNLPLDLHTATRFQRRVLEAIQAIPPGQVWSYGELAQRIGKPRAARAVGQALGANPIPIVIPCHRVVASDGGLGGYSGGLKVKEFLLRHEGAR